MAQYYDPIESTIPFSLYANQASTQRQRAREEKLEKKENRSMWANRLTTPAKMLEAKRAGDITDKQTLMAELDTRTATGKKFKSAEYVAPEREKYDPRKLSDWLNKRYGRSGRERVELEEWTPEAKKHIEDKQIQDLNLHDPNSPNRRGVFDPVKEQMKLERRSMEHNLPKQVEERRLHKIETDAYKKEYDRLKSMPKSEMELELGITDPTPPAAPAPLGDVAGDVNFLPQRPGNLIEQARAGLTGNVPSPQVDPSKFVGSYDVSRDLEIARTYKSAGQQFGKAAEEQGRLQEVLEGRQKQLPISGDKIITQAPSDQPISSLLGGDGLLDGSTSKKYGSFNELVKARNAARGTEGLGALQEQVREYMPKGTSYGEASKAFDAANTATETARAVEAGGDVIGSVGEASGGGVSPLGVAMEGKQLYDVFSEQGVTKGDQLKATMETGADVAASYGIASGNPFLAGAGLLWKGGQAAKRLLG
jgi:hypothetical protein